MAAMKKCANRLGLAFLAMAVVLLSEWSFTSAQSNEPTCTAPAKWMVYPKFAEGDQAKWKGKKLTATVRLVVNEGGDVIQAHIKSVKPKEAAQTLLSAFQQSKFQPRPGCGVWTIDVIFKLQ
ncbi:MAG TPA: hypothetical protein VIH46_00255 [Candidatus Acidoferrales bacterium]